MGMKEINKYEFILCPNCLSPINFDINQNNCCMCNSSMDSLVENTILLKNEKRSRREREVLNLSGLLRLAEIFDYDNDLLLGYLLQFKKITPENKKICNEQGILFFEQHKMQKEYKKLEAERKKRKQKKLSLQSYVL